MRILNCYMANDSKGHFVTAKEAAKHNRQDVLCCVSCGCPLTLQRGNDGQPPWFEHDQMTVAEKILLRCTWLDPAEKEARRLHLQGMKWSTKTGHRVRVFSSIDFPIRLVVTHHYIRAVLVRCNIQRYSPLLRELHR